LSLFSKSDYERESKDHIVSPRRASHGGVRTSKQVRLPTQLKSKVKYCRNCNCKNKDSAIICTQCDVTFRGKPVRRPMK